MRSWLARSALGRLIRWIRTPYYYREYDPFETVHITHRLIAQQEVPRWYPEYYERTYAQAPTRGLDHNGDVGVLSSYETCIGNPAEGPPQ